MHNEDVNITIPFQIVGSVQMLLAQRVADLALQHGPDALENNEFRELRDTLKIIQAGIDTAMQNIMANAAND